MHVQFQIGDVNVSLRLAFEISFDIYSGVFAGMIHGGWILLDEMSDVIVRLLKMVFGDLVLLRTNCVGDYTSKKLIADVESWHVQPCTFDIADCYNPLYI